MASNATETVLRNLRRVVLFGDGATLTDAQLLGRFVEHRDEAAFEGLMRRHGPMVFGVCARMLPQRQDAEDAFQATFLVLVRKAASVRPREMVGNWLYGVAHQTAMRARALDAKRRGRERQMANIPEPAATNSSNELQSVLDGELSRLPDRYRAAVVLCDLEGKTRQEAARQLGWPEGSVASRLSRGRALLAKRLIKHLPALSVAALATELPGSTASASVPASVMGDTIKAASLFAAGHTAATGSISVKVAALANGVLQTMNLTKWLTTTLAIVLISGLGAGLGFGGYYFVQTGKAESAAIAVQDQPAAQAKAPEPAPRKTDKELIVGVWRVKRGESDGKDIAPDFSSVGRFKFTKDGKMTLSAPAPLKTGTYELVAPGKIDLGPKDDMALAIYRFDGDNRLTLCFGGADKKRPSEFTADKGDRQVLWYLVRAKPGEENASQEEIDKHRDAERPAPAAAPKGRAYVIQVNTTKTIGMTRASGAKEDPLLTKVQNEAPKVCRVGVIQNDSRHILITGVKPGTTKITLSGHNDPKMKDLHDEVIEIRVVSDDEPILEQKRKEFRELIRKSGLGANVEPIEP